MFSAAQAHAREYHPMSGRFKLSGDQEIPRCPRSQLNEQGDQIAIQIVFVENIGVSRRVRPETMTSAS